MEAFPSFSTHDQSAVAEIGDRTQLLSLGAGSRAIANPAADHRRHTVRPTLANSRRPRASSGCGSASQLRPKIAGRFSWRSSMIAMATVEPWKPDKMEEGGAVPSARPERFFLCDADQLFFIAEIGDKTQDRPRWALAAAYPNLCGRWCFWGRRLGMLAANAPVVFLGQAFADRLPMEGRYHYGSVGTIPYALAPCSVSRALLALMRASVTFRSTIPPHFRTILPLP